MCAAQFVVTKSWKLPGYSPTDTWIKKMYLYILEYYVEYYKKSHICRKLDAPGKYAVA